jgi:hypothetical protein
MPGARSPVLRTVDKDGKRVGRPKNTEIRVREHLTPGEVEALAFVSQRLRPPA